MRNSQIKTAFSDRGAPTYDMRKSALGSPESSCPPILEKLTFQREAELLQRPQGIPRTNHVQVREGIHPEVAVLQKLRGMGQQYQVQFLKDEISSFGSSPSE